MVQGALERDSHHSNNCNMSSIIVVFPKKEIATNIRNILVRNGFDVIGVGVTGAQAVQ